MALILDGTAGITTPAISDSGNLTFIGTGNRITGDFSNATTSNRVSFQTSTVNGATAPWMFPNGSGTVAGIGFSNSSTYTNSSFGVIYANATQVNFGSAKDGAGSYLPMTFETGGSERMRIDTSGNVGIGTSSPGQRLHVATTGAAAGEYALSLQNPNTSAYSTVKMSFIARTGARAELIGQQDNTGNGGLFILNTADSSGTQQERMRIDSSGNVGIGVVPSGAYKLQVNGIGYFTSTGTPLYAQATGAGDSIISYAGTGNVTLTSVGRSSDNSSKIRFLNNAFSSELSSITETGSSTLTFATAGTERMRIDSSGNVGIGTSSPSRKLHVYAGATIGAYFVGWDNDFYAPTSTVGTGVLRIFSDVGGTNTNTAYIRTDGQYVQISDANLKKNIESARTDYVSDLQKLRVVKYNWITEPDNTPKNIGFIAQEVEQVFPRMVQTEENGQKMLKQDLLVPMLVAAIQELKAELDATKAELDATKAEVNDLKAQLEAK